LNTLLQSLEKSRIFFRGANYFSVFTFGVRALRSGIIDGMDDRLSKLAKAAAASMRGAPVDAQWIYVESLALIEDREAFQTNALWHTLVDSAGH
jgi:hypothetical protein